MTIYSLLYPVYPAYRKLWLGSGAGKKTAAHTHKGECGQRVSRFEQGQTCNYPEAYNL